MMWKKQWSEHKVTSLEADKGWQPEASVPIFDGTINDVKHMKIDLNEYIKDMNFKILKIGVRILTIDAIYRVFMVVNSNLYEVSAL